MMQLPTSKAMMSLRDNGVPESGVRTARGSTSGPKRLKDCNVRRCGSCDTRCRHGRAFHGLLSKVAWR